jgi:membrane-bound lytic murein transglycosylase D
MTTRLPAQTDTIVVRRNVHLEQVAAVLGIDIDMLRSLNPEYRRDIVPGLTKPSAIRLPLADAGRFIDNEDSIYNYRTDELLNKRLEVTINDDVPTYTRKATKKVTRKNSRARRNSRVTRNKRTSVRKTTARKRTTARKKVTARKKAPARKKTTAKRSRRRR